MNIRHLSAVVILLAACSTALAGTANINFLCSTGPLSYQAAGPGTLSSVDGRASFSAANRTLVAQGGNPVYNSGVTTVSMTLQPSGDAVNGVGLIMVDPLADDPLTALVYPDGTVVLTGAFGLYVSTYFTYPAAYNNTLTLSYDPLSDIATVTLNGTRSVSLNGALMGGGSVQVGVFSGGPGGFGSFSATGSGIQNYSSPVFGIVSYPGAGFKELYDPLRLEVQLTPGSTNVTFQWYKDGVELTGKTAAVYEIASLVPGDAGTYTCRITDGCGTVHDTPPAVVTVLAEDSLPAGGMAGMWALAALLMAVGGFSLRRRTV